MQSALFLQTDGFVVGPSACWQDRDDDYAFLHAQVPLLLRCHLGDKGCQRPRGGQIAPPGGDFGLGVDAGLFDGCPVNLKCQSNPVRDRLERFGLTHAAEIKAVHLDNDVPAADAAGKEPVCKRARSRSDMACWPRRRRVAAIRRRFSGAAR